MHPEELCRREKLDCRLALAALLLLRLLLPLCDELRAEEPEGNEAEELLLPEALNVALELLLPILALALLLAQPLLLPEEDCDS